MEVIKNKYLNHFLKSNSKYKTVNNFDEKSMKNIKSKYKNHFLCGNEEFNTLHELWDLHGFSSYNYGLFSLVNPDEYSLIARRFPNITETALVFGKTCMGGLFIFENLVIGNSILYLNVHKGSRKVVATNFDVFLSLDILAQPFWNRECYGKFESKVIDKFGPLEYNECYAFEPALALGGSESIKNINKVKVKEHLELLAQLY